MIHQLSEFLRGALKKEENEKVTLSEELQHLQLYLDMEKGDYYRALGRYNGSLGQPEYPKAVLAAWRGRWKYDGPTA